MKIFKSEQAAFKAGGDEVALLSSNGASNAGLRVLKAEGGYKVLIVPERGDGNPYYLER